MMVPLMSLAPGPMMRTEDSVIKLDVQVGPDVLSLRSNETEPGPGGGPSVNELKHAVHIQKRNE
jgi:hypothetical protein